MQRFSGTEHFCRTRFHAVIPSPGGITDEVGCEGVTADRQKDRQNAHWSNTKNRYVCSRHPYPACNIRDGIHFIQLWPWTKSPGKSCCRYTLHSRSIQPGQTGFSNQSGTAKIPAPV